MQKRISSDKITRLKDNEVFVFGSNLSGWHGAGAAKMAMRWGAIYGKGEGIQGNTYAIPTKSKGIKYTLELDSIKIYVDNFINYAKNHPEKDFLVTKIGTGLAGLKPKDVAQLFKDAIDVTNIYLPQEFWDYL